MCRMHATVFVPPSMPSPIADGHFTLLMAEGELTNTKYNTKIIKIGVSTLQRQIVI